MQIFSFLILLFGNDDWDADSEVSVSSVEFILPNTNNTLNDFSENCFSKALVSLLRDYDNEFSLHPSSVPRKFDSLYFYFLRPTLADDNRVQVWFCPYSWQITVLFPSGRVLNVSSAV